MAEVVPPLLAAKERQVQSPGSLLGGEVEIAIPLEAHATGDARVRLDLRRSWELDVAPTKSISVAVSIR